MMEKLWKRLVNRETVSYFVFGVLTTLIDWVVFGIYYEGGYSVALATNIAWAMAVFFAFVTNKLFVFRSYERSMAFMAKEFVSFVGCRLITWAFSLEAMIILVNYLGWNAYISKALICVAVLLFNYILSKLFIFRKKGKNL